jgi:hypothetical protein
MFYIRARNSRVPSPLLRKPDAARRALFAPAIRAHPRLPRRFGIGARLRAGCLAVFALCLCRVAASASGYRTRLGPHATLHLTLHHVSRRSERLSPRGRDPPARTGRSSAYADAGSELATASQSASRGATRGGEEGCRSRAARGSCAHRHARSEPRLFPRQRKDNNSSPSGDNRRNGCPRGRTDGERPNRGAPAPKAALRRPGDPAAAAGGPTAAGGH